MLKVVAHITNDEESKIIEVKYYQESNDFVVAVKEIMNLTETTNSHLSSLDIRHVNNAPECLIDQIEMTINSKS